MTSSNFLKPTSRKILFTIIIAIGIPIIVALYSGLIPFAFNSDSNSMPPTFNRGDIIIVKSVNFNDLNVGDIVMFESSGVMVAHRIV